MTEKRRGRPRKIKSNKAEMAIDLLKVIEKPVPINQETFNEAVERMIKEQNKVYWEDLAKKLENELQIVRLENEDLAKICVDRWEKIQDKDKIIKYLEDRIENLTIRSR
jgi:hypothetical protein